MYLPLIFNRLILYVQFTAYTKALPNISTSHDRAFDN